MLQKPCRLSQTAKILFSLTLMPLMKCYSNHTGSQERESWRVCISQLVGEPELTACQSSSPRLPTIEGPDMSLSCLAPRLGVGRPPWAGQ